MLDHIPSSPRAVEPGFGSMCVEDLSWMTPTHERGHALQAEIVNIVKLQQLLSVLVTKLILVMIIFMFGFSQEVNVYASNMNRI